MLIDIDSLRKKDVTTVWQDLELDILYNDIKSSRFYQ